MGVAPCSPPPLSTLASTPSSRPGEVANSDFDMNETTDRGLRKPLQATGPFGPAFRVALAKRFENPFKLDRVWIRQSFHS